MLRNHHRAALMFQTGDLVVEPGDGVLVQIGRGLVQHKNLRAHGIDRAEGQQLLLPTGQGEDAPPLQFLKVQGLHRIRHPPSDLLRRPALIFQTEGQFTVRVQIEELGFGVLEYGADFPGQLVHGCRSRVKSVHLHPPFQAAAGVTAGIRPLSNFVTVVLPQPEAPHSRTHSPGAMAALTWESVSCASP